MLEPRVNAAKKSQSSGALVISKLKELESDVQLDTNLQEFLGVGQNLEGHS